MDRIGGMMGTYGRLLAVLGVLYLMSIVSCSSGTAPTSSNSGQATAPTAVPTVAVATVAPKATAAPTQGAASSASTQATVPTTVPTTAPTAAPTTAQVKATAPATAVASSKPGTFGKADLDKIFPPGKGQDLIFRACVNCHNWVPLVMAGFDKAAWQQNKMNHRNRVSGLSDQEFDFLYEYLAQIFPPGHPVPDNIPEDLLSQWTSY